MRKGFWISLVILSISSVAAVIVYSQTKRPAAAPRASNSSGSSASATNKSTVDLGKLNGRTYRNETFNFEVTFPEGWLLADPTAEAGLRSKGVDLKLKAPKSRDPQDQLRLNSYAKRVTVLTTAFHPINKDESTVVRVAVEDLSRVPQVKDAVDYFDLMREGYKTMRLPSDFKYSETQAEKLGRKQFAFLDTTTAQGKTRMYATVRNGYAILFTLAYRSDDELQSFRRMLSEPNFALR